VTYCFRIRFRLGDHVKIQTADREWTFSDPGSDAQVALYGNDPTKPIEDARVLVLRGAGYPTDAAAQEAAARWLSVLQSAFARFGVGADFGDRAPQSAFTTCGLQHLEAETGSRVLNDVHGTMTFECEPAPVFAGWQIEVMIGRAAESLRRAIEVALSTGHAMTRRQQLAYDLFGGSFFTTSADARFVMLMMAVETLIEPKPRTDEVRRHVQGVIEATEQSGLDADEIRSIIGSLRWLLQESIRRAGQRLARSLGNRRYMDQPPERFFSDCYEMRSQLVHGAFPRPSRAEVDARAATLETFTGHLICGDLFNAVGD
jgi:hypothetical protein